MKGLTDDEYGIFVSTVGKGELELPRARFAGPIDLIVVCIPPAFSMEVASHEFELVTLRR